MPQPVEHMFLTPSSSLFDQAFKTRPESASISGGPNLRETIRDLPPVKRARGERLLPCTQLAAPVVQPRARQM